MNLALQSALSHFRIKNGVLDIGGIPLTTLVRKHRTPFFIYDKAIIKWRCNTLKQNFPEELKINYAVKANPNIKIIKLMSEFYDGFDVSSQGEIRKSTKAGISPKLMSFAGPGKTELELRYVVQNNIGWISLESEKELLTVQSLCKTLKKKVHILIRINPEFELTGSGMKMGGGPSQFGIDSELATEIIKKSKQYKNAVFSGLHIFCGSQNLNSQQLGNTFQKILEYAYNLSQKLDIVLKVVNLGGGLGVPYFSFEDDLNLSHLGQILTSLLQRYKKKMPGTTFKIELGRFLIAEAGIYVCRVLYRKISRGKIYIITDGGLHHHLAASGNFGQSLIKRPFPITIANKIGEPLERVQVVGCLCTPLDTFGYIDLPRAEEGDLLAVFNSGAYAYSASPINFLSHPPPQELVV